jgi:hypothetical protein
MTFISVLVLVVIAVLLYYLITILPVDARLKNILTIVLVVAIILWLITNLLPLTAHSLKQYRRTALWHGKPPSAPPHQSSSLGPPARGSGSAASRHDGARMRMIPARWVR